jgi:hypothetical protein
MAVIDQVKHLQRGDNITLHFAEENPRRLQVLAVHLNVAATPFIVDADGGVHWLREVEEVYVNSYADNLPATRHIYWIGSKSGETFENEYHHAVRIGHTNNGVWDYRGRFIETTELVDIIDGSRVFPLIPLEEL